MKVEIIAIGDELLLGQTVNTNASWIGKFIADQGGSVEYSSVIQDEVTIIKDALTLALTRSNVVLITGGLGPTKDDVTKQTLCEFFNTKLEINEEILAHVRSFFAQRGKEMLPVNIQQAALPVGAKILKNEVGTASGMWFEHNGKIVLSMPGVPYEMKHLLQDKALPLFKKRFEMEAKYYRTILFQGIGESFLADEIEEIETEIRSKGISVSYLPSPGIVRLRLTATKTKENKQLIKDYLKKISKMLPQYHFGKNEETLPQVVAKLLTKNEIKFGTVESCTGGDLARTLIALEGASSYFEGSIVSYSNKIKADLVGVSSATIKKHGAVSEEVVREMAIKGKKKLSVDYCVAISGVAGPSGGTEEKPAGCVWMALATNERIVTKKFQFETNRERNIKQTVLSALNLVRCEIKGIEP